MKGAELAFDYFWNNHDKLSKIDHAVCLYIAFALKKEWLIRSSNNKEQIKRCEGIMNTKLGMIWRLS